MNDEELERAAVDAIRSAADRLGVDPFRLARFLAHGRIAEYLQALGRSNGLDAERRESMPLSTAYLDFLGEERDHRDESGGPGGQASGV